MFPVKILQLINNVVIEFAFDPTKWQRRIHFNSGLLDVNYGKARDVVSQRDFLRGLAHMSFNESFSDECMLELLRGPDPSTNACKVSSLCRDVMVDNPDLGSGYSTTHRYTTQCPANQFFFVVVLFQNPLLTAQPNIRLWVQRYANRQILLPIISRITTDTPTWSH